MVSRARGAGVGVAGESQPAKESYSPFDKRTLSSFVATLRTGENLFTIIISHYVFCSFEEEIKLSGLIHLLHLHTFTRPTYKVILVKTNNWK